MKIIDLDQQHEDLYCSCMKGWCDNCLEAGSRKKDWLEKMLPLGLGVKIAIDDDGEAVGMIQYLPIEHSCAQGENLYFVQCICVHGYSEGIGKRQGRGMGKALLQAAEDDAREKGALGMAAWGMNAPYWMPAAWFVKHGYEQVDLEGTGVLVFKPFSEAAEPPRWIKRKKTPQSVAGKVSVTVFANGWCQDANTTAQRFKNVAAEFGDELVYRKIDTTDRESLNEWGIDNEVYIDDQRVEYPWPSVEELREILGQKIEAIKG